MQGAQMSLQRETTNRTKYELVEIWGEEETEEF